MTLPELAVTLALVGVTVGIALPPIASLRDRLGVRGAAIEIVASFAAARHAAIMRGSHVALTVDTTSATLTVRAAAETLEVRRLYDTHGVQLVATRDSVAFTPTGLGYGAANTTLIVRRNSFADTVVVSRMGRVRR